MNIEPPPRSILEFSTIWKDWLHRLYIAVKENMNGDFKLDVAAGRINGHSVVTKFGRNPAVQAAADEDIWAAGGSLTYLTSASTIRVKVGGNSLDDTAGTGAQKVVISGLDANYAEVTDTLVTAGASASAASTNSYLRVHTAYVTEVGGGGVNAGDITLEAVTGGTTQAFIPASEGRTQQLLYTVPAGKTAYVTGVKISCDESPTGAIKETTAHVKGFIRTYNTASTNNYNSWMLMFEVDLNNRGTGAVSLTQEQYSAIPEKTDIRMTADVAVNDTEVTARLFMYLVDN